MRWAKPLGWLTGAILVFRFAVGELMAQCAMCRTALASSPEGQKLASGFNSGILFLLSAPFLIVAIGAVLILKPYRRRGLRQPD